MECDRARGVEPSHRCVSERPVPLRVQSKPTIPRCDAGSVDLLGHPTLRSLVVPTRSRLSRVAREQTGQEDRYADPDGEARRSSHKISPCDELEAAPAACSPAPASGLSGPTQRWRRPLASDSTADVACLATRQCPPETPSAGNYWLFPVNSPTWDGVNPIVPARCATDNGTTAHSRHEIEDGPCSKLPRPPKRASVAA